MRFGDLLRIDTSGRFAMTAFRLNDCTALPSYGLIIPYCAGKEK